MLNQIVIVGRLVQDLEKKELENERELNVTLAVPRSYKNLDGEYDTDFIPVKMFGQIAKSTREFCEKGDLIGIRGRVQSRKEEDKIIIEIIAEKATFLNNHKETKND